MGHAQGDVNLVALSETESSFSAEPGWSFGFITYLVEAVLCNELLFFSSPHPDPNLNSATQQRDDYPGLEPIEARLMDHNDLFVLDFGKRQIT